jgi:hypothetical protein
MQDETEDFRRERIAELNSQNGQRKALEARYGQIWDTVELRRDFVVLAFLAPFVEVRRRVDGQGGSLEFQADPRYYFSFCEG